MTGLSFAEQYNWRMDIKNKLEHYECDYKVKCFNPVEYYNFEDSTVYDSQREIMLYELHKVERANLVIVNFNSPNSLGTMAEITTAYNKKIPIIGLNENKTILHPWQNEMCNKIFSDKEDMFLYIMNYYLD